MIISTTNLTERIYNLDTHYGERYINTIGANLLLGAI